MRRLDALGADAAGCDHGGPLQERWPPRAGRPPPASFWGPAPGAACSGPPRARRGSGGSAFLWGGAGARSAPGCRERRVGAAGFQAEGGASPWGRCGLSAGRRERGAGVESLVGQGRRAARSGFWAEEPPSGSRRSEAKSSSFAKEAEDGDADGREDEDAEEPDGDEDVEDVDAKIEKMSCQQLKAKLRKDEEDAGLKMAAAEEDEVEATKDTARGKNGEAAGRGKKSEEEAEAADKDMAEATDLKAAIKKKCDKKDDEVNAENVGEKAKKDRLRAKLAAKRALEEEGDGGD